MQRFESNTEVLSLSANNIGGGNVVADTATVIDPVTITTTTTTAAISATTADATHISLSPHIHLLPIQQTSSGTATNNNNRNNNNTSTAVVVASSASIHNDTAANTRLGGNIATSNGVTSSTNAAATNNHSNIASEALAFRSTTYHAKTPSLCKPFDTATLYIQEVSEDDNSIHDMVSSALTLEQLYSIGYQTYVSRSCNQRQQEQEHKEQKKNTTHVVTSINSNTQVLVPPPPPEFDGNSAINLDVLSEHVHGLAKVYQSYHDQVRLPSPFEVYQSVVEKCYSKLTGCD